MQTNILKLRTRIIVLLISVFLSFNLRSQTVTTYSYSGSVQTFTVPYCVRIMTIDLSGAQGGGGSGGLGGRVRCTYTVTPGDVLYIYIGGRGGSAGSNATGGYNGGGSSGASNGYIYAGSGGGGASDIRFNGTSLNNRIIVAGGGGGYNTTNPGAGPGGGTTGGNATSASSQCISGLATGGTQLAGGVSCIGSSACCLFTVSASAATLGLGGYGEGPAYGCNDGDGGGGGGGGYYGGGGGGVYSSGGGGSSYASITVSNVVHTQGYNTGPGILTFTYNTLDSNAAVTISKNTVCSGDTVSLTTTGLLSYTWMPTGSFAGSNSITITDTPTVSTTYTVWGITNSGCINFFTASVVTIPLVPSLSIVNTASLGGICPGGTVGLNATGANSYSWTGGNTPFQNGVIFTPTITTTYTVTGFNNCGSGSVVTSVSVYALPSVTPVASSTSLCSGSCLSLTAIGNATNYVWLNNVPYGACSFPSITDTYTVIGTNSLGCVTSATIQVTVISTPTIITTANPPIICSGETSTINATGGINFTVTSSSSTAIVNSLPISQVYTSSTLYTITGDNSFGCTSSVSQVIIVNPNPILTTTASKTLVCSSGSAVANATGADTYSWSNGTLTHSNVVNPVSLVTGPVIYTVTGTYTSTTCHTDQTVALSVFIPTITVTGSTSACYGGNITLAASGATGNNYYWYTGTSSVATSSSSSLMITMTTSAVYTITVLTTSHTAVLCPSSKTISLTVFFNPTITAVAQRTPICAQESVVLTVNGGDQYLWNTGENTQTISVSPISTTNYIVTGTGINGCISTGTVQVKVSSCTGIGEQNAATIGLSVYPNPNSGEFVIQTSTDIKVSLVNELGQLIRVIELSGANNYKVSVNDLAKGIYFLTGTKDNVQVNQKIVVAK